MINAETIYNELVSKYKDIDIPLMYAMLEEVSEDAANSDVADDKKVSVALIAFYSSLKSMMAVLNAAFQNSDRVIINYRGRSFELTPESLFVKAFSQL